MLYLPMTTTLESMDNIEAIIDEYIKMILMVFLRPLSFIFAIKKNIMITLVEN